MNKSELLARLKGRLTHPSRADEIFRLLRVARADRPGARRALRNLLSDGDLVLVRGNLYAWPRGNRQRTADPAGSAPREIIGRFDRDARGHGYVTPLDRKAGDEVRLTGSEEQTAEPGEMVVVAITRPASSGRPPQGHIVDVFGPLDEPGVDTAIVLRAHGIPEAHSDDAVAEAASIGAAVNPADIQGRTDFRDRLVVTIDGEHARDFDDAISIERLPNGHYWLGVHIADVAHYVREGSALDRDAYERGTSVYFPERAVHMFPEALATGVCSLNPHVDRLVQSCLMEVNARGDVVRYEMHDGVIRSDARMTYTEVNAILTEPAHEDRQRYAALVPTFERMGELFAILNRRRRDRGAVDFDLPEAMIVLGEDGLVSDIVASERNIAHRLIEEFMLLANETVASHLEHAGMPSLYRIHERPDPLKAEEFAEFVAALGYPLGESPDRLESRHFQALADSIRGTPVERPIAFLMLRTMQKARYDSVNMGHFGLAAASYTHFTSPIRRYPDLVVHRLLRELRHTRVTSQRRETLEVSLPEIGRHTSERERRAIDAEREVIQWKKVRFMADKVGDTFDGYVTGVTAFGMFVELEEHYVEGLAHVSGLGDDYFQFDAAGHALTGERTGQRYRLGDRVRVQVARVDMDRRMVDLAIVGAAARTRPATKHGRAERRDFSPAGNPGTMKRARKSGKSKPRARRKVQRPGKRERVQRRKR